MHLNSHILAPASNYINGLALADNAAVLSDIEAMKSGDFDSVHTKQLKGEVRELIVGRHRISYCNVGSTLYFIRGFYRKSAKTPKYEIEYATQVLKLIKIHHENKN